MTLSTLTMAQEHQLKIIPVVNKIDLPHAEPDRVAEELVELLKIKKEEIIFASGKTGEGIEEILTRIISDIPAPTGNPDDKSRALIFDSFFDSYKGVIIYVRIFDGELKKNDKIKMMGTGSLSEVLEIGYILPLHQKQEKLACGEIGYIVTGVKDVSEASVGDTITNASHPAISPLPGYQKVVPYVFAGLFTTTGEDYQTLREALTKLSLSDSSLTYDPESSVSLGFGFRCGFLGLLHMEIVKERLEREFHLDLIATTPSVSYQIEKTNGEIIEIKNPTEMPDKPEIKEVREPWVNLEVVTPTNWIGSIMTLTQKRRGVLENINYLDEHRAIITFQIPLVSIVTDYFDVLKSASSGYASMGYEVIGYKPSELVKMDILINQKPIDTLSVIIHKDEAYEKGNDVTEKLKTLIPKQNFKIIIQAALGGKIIARKDIAPFRKDVTEKLYGGDVTRKRKLLEKQKAGKRKMKMIG
ncbi:MAG: translation elongation factor 4, partial [Bacteriovoracaceae bacterium]